MNMDHELALKNFTRHAINSDDCMVFFVAFSLFAIRI